MNPTYRYYLISIACWSAYFYVIWLFTPLTAGILAGSFAVYTIIVQARLK